MINQEIIPAKPAVTDENGNADVHDDPVEETAVEHPELEASIVDDTETTLTDTLQGVLDALKTAGDGLESQFTSRWSHSPSDPEAS